MIKANELRIGNLVDFGDPEPDSGGHMKGCLENRVITASDIARATEWPVYYPIPLTAEWLERMGFKNDHSTYEFADGSNNGRLFITWIENDLVAEFGNGDRNIPVELKYVHYLQNLYFALTGEELTIKQTNGNKQI
jgi:hypothetical protein